MLLVRFITVSSDPNVSKLQDYTINLYKEIEETSGHSISMHTTGGYYLALKSKLA